MQQLLRLTHRTKVAGQLLGANRSSSSQVVCLAGGVLGKIVETVAHEGVVVVAAVSGRSRPAGGEVTLVLTLNRIECCLLHEANAVHCLAVMHSWS
jgi:hypothetical protein